MLNSFIEMLSYGFILRAFIAGLIISICSALLGSCIVLRKQSMIGDGLSHVAFGAVAIATILGIAPLEFAIPIVIIASFFILRLSDNSKINGDSAIALLSASALAIGTIAISINTGTNIDLNSYLFGSILAVTEANLTLCVILGIIIISVFVVFYKQIFAVTFDEKFAKSIGINVKFYNALIAILCSLVVVVGMKILGALLISSLIIFPSITASFISHSFKRNVINSVLISSLCLTFGLTLSYALGTPAGATIVTTNLGALILAWVYNKLR